MSDVQDTTELRAEQNILRQTLDNISDAMSPIYSTASADQSLTLYQGPLDVTINNVTHVWDGAIYLRWYPSPRIEYVISLPEGSPPTIGLTAIFGDDTEMKIVAPSLDQIPVNGLPEPSPNADKAPTSTSIAGVYADGLTIGSSTALKSLIFHLANYPGYEGESIKWKTQNGENSNYRLNRKRARLSVDGWSIVIDCVKDYETLVASLKQSGGFAITHVGKVEREDGSEFTAEKAQELLESMTYLLSFAAGRWTGPLMFVGFDENEERVWVNWRVPRLDRWHSCLSWFPHNRPAVFAELAPGYFGRYANPVWQDAIRVALNWYLQANSSDTIETGLILTQVALELISWVDAVEDRKAFSARDFDKKKASEKIREMLTNLGISTDIPKHKQKLTQLAGLRPFDDGPHAFTDLRNASVHGNKLPSLLAVSWEARYEALQLGLWYLELILLALFDYEGTYFNRIGPYMIQGVEEPVPWQGVVSP